jgi:hypothetical protein
MARFGQGYAVHCPAPVQPAEADVRSTAKTAPKVATPQDFRTEQRICAGRLFYLWTAMRLVLPLVLLCILSPTIGRAALIPVSAETQIEPATSFTTLELWNSTTPTSVDVGGVVVSYQMIDSEAPIIRGKWRECGLVMIGTGDLATRPVAFRVWTRHECNLSMQRPKGAALQKPVRLNFAVNSAASLPIRISSGLVVTVAGRQVGRIRTDAGKRDR